MRPIVTTVIVAGSSDILRTPRDVEGSLAPSSAGSEVRQDQAR
jgi:hypothetical protein